MTAALIAIALICALPVMSAESKNNNTLASIHSDQIITYKTVKTEKGTFDLKLHVFQPEKPGRKRPCIVMFHGGGWINGAPTSCYGGARRRTKQGVVCVAVEYRIRSKHGGTPLDSVRDAKSAMRWVRSHADELGVDPERIAASGGSAGGHLAAACATLSAFNEEGEDASVSCVPNALLLNSPVLDNGLNGGYGHYHKAIRQHWKDFSPFHNIGKSMPPTLLSVGDNERKHLRIEIVQELKKKIEALGSTCEVIVLKGATHYKKTEENREMLGKATNEFLKSLGYIAE